MLHCNVINPFITLMGTFNWGPISCNDIVSTGPPTFILKRLLACENIALTVDRFFLKTCLEVFI